MKLPTNSYSKRHLLIVTAVALFVIIGVGAIYRNFLSSPDTNQNPTGSQGIDYSPPTQSEQDAGKKAKEQTINNTSGKPAAPGTDTNPSGSTSGDAVSVTITAMSQSSGTLSIRSLIEAITTTGSCTITLTRGSVVITKTSGIQALANASTCKGFDIPTSELAPGTWNVSLSINIDNKTGSTSKSVVIN